VKLRYVFWKANVTKTLKYRFFFAVFSETQKVDIRCYGNTSFKWRHKNLL